MKHLKIFEDYFTTSTSPNIELNYNDEPKLPKLSNIINHTTNYINEYYNNINTYSTFNSINQNKYEINFDKPSPLYRIMIDTSGPLKILTIIINKQNDNNKAETYNITNDEYEYLKNFFINIIIKLQKDEEKENISKNILDPIKRNIDKYNI